METAGLQRVAVDSRLAHCICCDETVSRDSRGQVRKYGSILRRENKCRNIFWLATTAREHQTARRLKHTLILSEKEAYVSILELWPKEKISYLLQV